MPVPSSPILNFGKKLRYLISPSSRKAIIDAEIDKCFDCADFSATTIRNLNFNTPFSREATQVIGFNVMYAYKFRLPENGLMTKVGASVTMIYQNPIPITSRNYYFRHHANLAITTCGIKGTYYGVATRNLRIQCREQMEKLVAERLGELAVDAGKTVAKNTILGLSLGVSIGVGIHGCQKANAAPYGVIDYDCEWNESINILEKKRDVVIDGEVFRYDEPVVSSPCPIDIVLISDPGQYRLSKKVTRMKGWSIEHGGGVPAPGELVSPWQGHTPIGDWTEIDPPFDEYGTGREQLPTYWGGEELGVSNMKSDGSMVDSLFDGLGTALELLNIILTPLLLRSPMFMGLECIIQDSESYGSIQA